MTTLEWLLVVAAVAGLAAVACGVGAGRGGRHRGADRVSQRAAAGRGFGGHRTGERLEGASPRRLRDEANRINERYARRCRQLAIIYTDVLKGTDIIEGIYDPTPPGGWLESAPVQHPAEPVRRLHATVPLMWLPAGRVDDHASMTTVAACAWIDPAVGSLLS